MVIMSIWFVDWEDLSTAWSSKEKALEFLRQEAERINAKMVITEEWKNSFWVAMVYEDGETVHIDCCEYPIDELPY